MKNAEPSGCSLNLGERHRLMSQPGIAKKVSIRLLASLLVLLVAFTTISQESGKSRASSKHDIQLRDFVAAFNARNIEAMLSSLDEGFQWLNVQEAKITIEVEGKTALRDRMERYFRSCSSCKSSLEWVQNSGTRVTAMERASWTSKSGPKSQASLSVYEFRNDKILRVYYFPVDADESATEPN